MGGKNEKKELLPLKVNLFTLIGIVAISQQLLSYFTYSCNRDAKLLCLHFTLKSFRFTQPITSISLLRNILTGIVIIELQIRRGNGDEIGIISRNCP